MGISPARNGRAHAPCARTRGRAPAPHLPARGLDLLRELAPGCPVPIYGIGGVTPDNAASVLEAGASGVAVSSAVLDARDVGAAARALVEALR